MEMEHAEVPQMHLMQLAMPSGSRLMIPFSDFWCPAKICLAQRAQLRGPCACVHTYLISYTVYTAYIVYTQLTSIVNEEHKVNTVCRTGIQLFQKDCEKEITFQKLCFWLVGVGSHLSARWFAHACSMPENAAGLVISVKICWVLRVVGCNTIFFLFD